MNRIIGKRRFIIGVSMAISSGCFAQYHETDHRQISGNEVAVKTPGSYAEEGAVYVLANDISSTKSPLFLGKDVVLDLNGYTLKYADGNYEHISNSGFEEGLEGWDISKAPGAKVVNTADVHVFLGEKLLSLQAGDEITSPYVHLPVSDRSYFAMCGITGRYWHDMKKYPRDEMKISIFVEDEQGNEIQCITEYGDSIMQSCPVEKKRPRLGGGFIYAHLRNVPAGRYRVRVRADTDCLVDEIDIRPAMDVGISIIDQTTPLAHYDHVIKESRPPIIPAFYDYTEDFKARLALEGLPRAEGRGSITIKNGVIESGADGILSWGIQSSAAYVKVVLENVKIKTSGISSGAADISYAKIENCSFEVDMPFLIQRHVGICSVILRGKEPSEISHSAFYGGQGCLSVKGEKALVHDNFFENNQRVTNHYSIMGTGDSSKIYNNIFDPKQGSGIYVSRYTEVFNNTFNIETSPPTCEYGREEYSTAAIRLGDYHAKPGSLRASVGNRIHHNDISITARSYPEPAEYLPMAWGIFYSASGGENYVYENNFVVNKVEPDSRVKTAALYICGGPKYFGGQFYNNQISTNVPAAWVATMYGGASNSHLFNNTIIAQNDEPFPTFTMGFSDCETCYANHVEFRSNEVKGGKFEIEATDQHHIYSVFWTLHLTLLESKGTPGAGKAITILDRNGKVVLETISDEAGMVQAELPEYAVDGKNKTTSTPYTIIVGNLEKEVNLDSNQSITMTIDGE